MVWLHAAKWVIWFVNCCRLNDFKLYFVNVAPLICMQNAFEIWNHCFSRIYYISTCCGYAVSIFYSLRFSSYSVDLHFDSFIGVLTNLNLPIWYNEVTFTKEKKWLSRQLAKKRKIIFLKFDHEFCNLYYYQIFQGRSWSVIFGKHSSKFCLKLFVIQPE